MERVVELVREYRIQQSKLKSQYNVSVRAQCPDIQENIQKIESMMCKGEYGYDVIAEYEKIAESFKMHQLNDVLTEVVKQRLREEYVKISKLQQEVAKLLGYNEEDVTIDKMISDWETSKELLPGLSWNSQMSTNLRRLRDIHKSQENMFEDKLDEEESKFLRMTEEDIQEHNKRVLNRVKCGVERNELCDGYIEDDVKSGIIPMWDIRGGL